MARGRTEVPKGTPGAGKIKVDKKAKYKREAEKRQAKREENARKEAEEKGIPLDQVEVKKGKLNRKAKRAAARANGASDVKPGETKPAPAPVATSATEVGPAAKEPEWETDDEDQDASDDEDAPERAAIDLSHLDDSDSDISSDEEENQALEAEAEDEDAEDDDDEEEDDEDDIALSDLDSVASEEKGDIIPHQRLTINNTAALTAALHRIQLPYSKLAFSEYQSVTTDEPVDIPDVEDDLNRELAFYKQCLSSVKDARKKLKKEGVSFSRPNDYFAEMVKSDEHMGKIKQKLIDAAAGKKAAAEARKQRDLKKFGKQVQTAKLQERSKEKRDTIEKINTLKRKRQGADITATHEEDLFDVAATADDKKSDRRGGDKSFNKRQKKDEKYGFGGKKRHAKSNDAKSSADGSGFSARKMKGKPVGGASKSKRPGKDNRAKNR